MWQETIQLVIDANIKVTRTEDDAASVHFFSKNLERHGFFLSLKWERVFSAHGGSDIRAIAMGDTVRPLNNALISSSFATLCTPGV